MLRFVLLKNQPSEVVSGGFLRTQLGTADAVVVLSSEVPLMALVEELRAHALSLQADQGEADAEARPSD